MIARISSTSRTLELDFGYLGGARLNELVIFNEIHLTLDTDVIAFKLDTPIEVTGPKRVTVPIPTSKPANLQTQNI
jgi:hypothetical protein